MPRVAAIDDDTMFNAWVAHNRNATQAAKHLSMKPVTMIYHIRTKDFHQRYLMEYGGVAEGVMRTAITQAMLAMPDAVSELLELMKVDHMVTDPDTGDLRADARIMTAKVKAIEALTKFLPEVPERLDDFGLSHTIEGVGVLLDQPTTMSPEEEVRTMLEANIVDNAEKRSKPRR